MPARPMRVAKSHHSIATCRAFILADVAEHLTVAVDSGSPTSFKSIFLQTYIEQLLPLSSLIAFNLSTLGSFSPSLASCSSFCSSVNFGSK